MLKTSFKILFFSFIIYLFGFTNVVIGFNNDGSIVENNSIEFALERNQKRFDSLASIMLYCNDIDELSRFINSYPDGLLLESLKTHRRKLFKESEYVLKSNLDIDSILLINPCYTPIYRDIDRTPLNKKYGFNDLTNDFLSSSNPYFNRFLLADLNTIDDNQNSLGVAEIFPRIEDNWEFTTLLEILKEHGINRDNFLEFDKSVIDSIVGDKKENRISLMLYRNYIDKVEAYKTDPIVKNRSIHNGKQYVAGQKICMCEVQNDSIYFAGQFVTSSRGKSRREIKDSVSTGPKKYHYFEAMPTGKDVNYYAPLYRITSKNWETQRDYDKIDELRDSLMGGGNKRVTFFDGKVELPNFLLMLPDPDYPRAMKQNGIHESSLSIVSKCMLGTPQSLGCLRMSDYTSKFLRWWTPQNAKLFVYIDDNRYVNEVIDDIYNEMPFKTEKEGNIFRRWVNKYHPNFADKLGLDKTGPCANCYIYQAWNEFKSEFLISEEGRSFSESFDSSISTNENHL